AGKELLVQCCLLEESYESPYAYRSCASVRAVRYRMYPVTGSQKGQAPRAGTRLLRKSDVSRGCGRVQERGATRSERSRRPLSPGPHVSQTEIPSRSSGSLS